MHFGIPVRLSLPSSSKSSVTVLAFPPRAAWAGCAYTVPVWTKRVAGTNVFFGNAAEQVVPDLQILLPDSVELLVVWVADAIPPTAKAVTEANASITYRFLMRMYVLLVRGGSGHPSSLYRGGLPTAPWSLRGRITRKSTSQTREGRQFAVP